MPSHIKPISCKWICLVKLKSDRSWDRYKACFVALGNRPEYGLDNDETFPPVAKMTTVPILFALVASQSWPLFRMDIKNAFLH